MNREQALIRLREVLRRKHFALSTERTYRAWLCRYIGFVRKLSGSLSSEQRMERFLTQLAKDDVAASTQNQAFNALLFFYQECLGQKLEGIHALRAKRESVVRRAPAASEVRVLLDQVRDRGPYPVRLVVKLIYGCGLRINEPLNIRVRDLDLPNSRVIIRRAKGGKDRVVPLPCSLIGEIGAQLTAARVIWERDRAAQVPIKLPGRLDRKYPHAPFSWQWAWLFPQMAPCKDPRTGRTVRWHMLPSSVSRAIKAACRKMGVDILPHELRHSYATHCLNSGQNPRSIQMAMGHKSLETTMGYLHAEAMSVRSPLDRLESAAL